MLQELYIKNLALIDEARVRFGEGFNVLTGETGAGKTVVVGAVNLLLGGRADSSLIRKGASKAEVVGVFAKTRALEDLEDIGEGLSDLIEGEDQVIMRRLISADGKNKCYINERAVTLSSLAEVGRRCIDLHGQHEGQSLFKTSTHVDFLDKYAGKELLDLRYRFGKLHKHLKQLKGEHTRIKSAERDLLGRKDLLKFQINEIDSAGLVAGEDEGLTKERDILRNSERIIEAVSIACGLLEDDDSSSASTSIPAVDLIARASNEISTIAGYNSILKNIAERLSGLLIEVGDCAASLKEFIGGFDVSPGRLEEAESRLAQISLMKRKYGTTIGDILRYRASANEELALCDTSEELLDKLTEDIVTVTGELCELADKQSGERRRVAKSFALKVCGELADLNMPNAVFDVSFTRELDPEGLPVDGVNIKIQANGIDKIEFIVSANKGETAKQLARIASGGEISRIMLALKIILADVDETPTLIFDEIDVGIGGKTAVTVGRKMALLSRKHQVISVTHLPQIASFGDRHLTVSKREADDNTVTEIKRIVDNDKVKEMARLLSGNTESLVSLKHAEELLLEAQETKRRV